MSRHLSFTLTTTNRAIVEGMLHREGGHTGPRAFALRRKLEGCIVVPPSDIAPDIATLSSRVRFRLDEGQPEERALVANHAEEIMGLTLLAWTSRGLALLGMRAGQQARILRLDGTPETIMLLEVLYQPEAQRHVTGDPAWGHLSPRPNTSGRPLSPVQRLHRPTRIWREPDGDGDGPSAA